MNLVKLEEETENEDPQVGLEDPIIKEEEIEPQVTPLPWKPISVLCCVILSESFAINMIFPFIADMVKSFGITNNDEEIGFYAGCFWWGRASDYFGRKPVILMGLGGNVLMIFLFGWSTNLWYAILARSLNGFLNGNVGVAKTIMSEITDDTNVAKGFSLFAFVSGFGFLLGPTVGGFLSNPHNIAPDIFPKGSLLHRFPYLLPCIFSSLVSFTGFIFGFIFLQETLPNPRACNPRKDDDEITESDILMDKRENNNNDNENNIKKEGQLTILEILKSKEVVICSFLYASIGFNFMSFDEIFSIWSTYPVSIGGINFSSNDIGITYLINGVFLILTQVLVFPLLAKRFNLLRLYQISNFLMILTAPVYPCLTYVAPVTESDPQWKLWLCITFVLLSRAVTGGILFTSIFILINHTVPNSSLGSVNGFAQSFCSFTRALAPITSGSLLAWSMTNGLGFPFNSFFSFFIISFIFIIGLIASFFLPSTINQKKIKHENVECNEEAEGNDTKENHENIEV